MLQSVGAFLQRLRHLRGGGAATGQKKERAQGSGARSDGYAIREAALLAPYPCASEVGAGFLRELGVGLYMFLVGLKFDHKEFKESARSAAAVSIGGMVAPALIFIAFAAGAGDGALSGWANPTATDIAFAIGASARLL